MKLLADISACILNIISNTLRFIVKLCSQVLLVPKNLCFSSQSHRVPSTQSPSTYQNCGIKSQDFIITTDFPLKIITIDDEQDTQSTSVKTSDNIKSTVVSFVRSLSIHKFMDYCVNALNEASTSSSINKFDHTSHRGKIWIMGVEYDLPEQADKFVHEIRSKIWITYRKNFPPLDASGRYTSDKGFGCMIRCGQMVIANALIFKNLGRDWRWSDVGMELNPSVYIKILKLFQDKENSFYSIHNITHYGENEGKNIGEWFGPNTIAQSLKRLSKKYSNDEINSTAECEITIDVALDNVVVVDEVCSKFKKKGSETEWVPGVLFIQLRLGLSNINPLYFSALKKTFCLKQSLGMIGGRPNHALYLIGHTDDEVFYLDPHSTQPYIDLDEEHLDEKANEEAKLIPRDSSYHCSNVEKMQLDKLDPSLALCFYFSDEEDFEEWCKNSTEMLIKSEKAPMFEIVETRSNSWGTGGALKVEDASLQQFVLL